VRLGTETYVDGGVRQCVPVEIAVRAGADRLFTIANTPLAAAQSPSTFVGANFLSILQRAYTVVSQHEILRSNLFAGGIGNVPNTVVMPTVYTHGLMEINPGLMLIGWDYGYLRAGDALRDLSPAVRARAMRYTDSIVLLRTEAWHVEETDLAPDGPSGAVERLRVYKWLTARLARSRAALGVPMPPEASRWWLEWERHECPLAPRTPWQEQAFESYVPSRVALKDPAGGTATIAGGVISAPGDDGRAEADGVLVVTVPPGAIEALREALGGA
ncbi:MAG TPA: hypothetical protein VMS64_32600, partial [Candidatus Methylomirabilis sp.]|nr:hypothetical protein [Candidatus Methylomirabilis sp.]